MCNLASSFSSCVMAANLELSESLATVTAFANNPDNIRAVHIAILGKSLFIVTLNSKGFSHMNKERLANFTVKEKFS